MEVKGSIVDQETRCIHYHSKRDIIAIKFACCNHYYPCYLCHNEHEKHAIKPWPKSQFTTKAVLCGSCNHELTINEYLSSEYTCPHCGARFNENCSLHSTIYFETQLPYL